ncbi:hypothetical protein [Azospirillum sp. sgz302134]
MPGMSRATLERLAGGLKPFTTDETVEAATLIEDALINPLPLDIEADERFAATLRDLVRKALARNHFAPEERHGLEGIETELTGRVLFARQQIGAAASFLPAQMGEAFP